MLEQHRLNLSGCHRETFVLDHLFAAVENKIEAVGVARDNISRPVPAIAQCTGRGFGRLPIPEHELRTAHNQLAGFPDGGGVAVLIDDLALSPSQPVADGFLSATYVI